MASTSASTEELVMASESELPRVACIEAWKSKAGPVRRNLFGSVNHQQLQRDFQRLLCMGVEEANKRWNFDFQSDRPGNGSSIEWTELRRQDVPAFYHSCTVRPVEQATPEVTQGLRRPSPSSAEGSPMSSSSSGSGDEYLEVTARGCFRLKRSRRRGQPAITDFFKVKKRRLLHYKASSRQ
ncbi:cyclin-dependent kinase inhibitor 1D isoform X2 [Cololabis saira]|nr:cyclin-dependent kinase inhibitor 1D isoform X2 [Cololabis saira]